MTLKCVTFDTRDLGDFVENNGDRSIAFFQKTLSAQTPSIKSEITESEAIRLLFVNQRFGTLFFGELFTGPQTIKAAAEIPISWLSAGTKPGDIDIIAAEPERPYAALALQCKVLKLVATGEGNRAKINKLGDLEHGVSQINSQIQHGFRSNYLCLFFIIDSRACDSGNVLNNTITHEFLKGLLNMLAQYKLSTKAGIILAYFTQSMDKPFDSAGQFGVELIRLTEVQAQPHDLTESIGRLLADSQRTACITLNKSI